eukprot:scaffold108751_cov56-Attheya_sp.AAC.1
MILTMRSLHKGSSVPKRVGTLQLGIKGNNFKNDPLVSSKLVKFLAVNTGFESIDKLQREVTELKEKVFASAKAVNLAEKSAFLAANKADELKMFCDTLVKRVTTLEKK